MIEEVKQIFDDIRDAIIEMGGNIDVCSSPEEYAEAIKELTGNTAVLFIPCFKSSESKPSTPIKTMSPADPTDYPEGGGTPDGLTGKIGMTYTMVSTSTVYVPGTEPVLLGEAGSDPQPSTFDDATTRTFLIFLELPSLNIIPTRPVGGNWNTQDNILYNNPTFTFNGVTYTWASDNNHVEGNYTWLSQGTFLAETGELIGAGTNPICINSVKNGRDGKDGRNGQDGTDIEFIYKLAHSETEGRQFPTPESENIDDYVPGPNPNTRGYWCDHPMGIDGEEYLVEMMCTREKNKETGDGGPFIGPVVGSSWGEDGTDGDGIEYIFRVATNNEVTQDSNGKYHLNDIGTGPPTCGDGCANAFYTIASGHGYTREQLTEMYQQDEGVPGDDAGNIGWDRNGTDDPRDVDVNEPFEFVSVRKYNGTTGTGSWFSEPVLWNKYYISSAPIFTSFAFCRSTKNLGSLSLSGGTVINPLPNDQTVDGELIHWYNSIPGAAEYPNSTRAVAPIGMTSSKFGSADPTVVIAANWSSPMLLADNKYFNVEYSNSDIDPSAPSFRLPKFDETIGSSKPFIDLTNPEGVNESAGRQYCTQHSLGTGSDDVSNPKGMATCTFNGGIGSEGTLTQIKGEDGQDGTDGTDGRGIVSVAYYYMWSNDGTNHPSASDPGWSSSIPANPNNYTYLWRKTVTTYSSGTTTETTYEIISKTGQRGPIGPKMRMRNGSESYTAPDEAGMSGGLSGDGASDLFYDIAIYPPASEGINITNAVSNADRLYRCTQSITYAEIADLVTTYGVGNVHPGSGGHLDSYFTQAVGWDFVATKLLLADRIRAEQIDATGISVDKLVTTPDIENDPGSYINAEGNTMTLYKSGNPSCIITADPLATDASETETVVGATALGEFLSSNNENGFHFTRELGRFTIETTGSTTSTADYLKSLYPQWIALQVTGTANKDITFGPGQRAFVSHLFITAKNMQSPYNTYYGRQNGYVSELCYIPQGQSGSQTFHNGDNIVETGCFKLDTTDPFLNLPVGTGKLELSGDLLVGFSPNDITNYKLTAFQYTPQSGAVPPAGDSQITNASYHSPITLKRYSVTNSQTTEIASDGFAHVLNSGNYFKLRHPIDNVGGVDTPDPNTLLMEFRVTDPNNATNAYGLKVDKTGIYKGVYNAGTLQTGDGVKVDLPVANP